MAVHLPVIVRGEAREGRRKTAEEESERPGPHKRFVYLILIALMQAAVNGPGAL